MLRRGVLVAGRARSVSTRPLNIAVSDNTLCGSPIATASSGIAMLNPPRHRRGAHLVSIRPLCSSTPLSLDDLEGAIKAVGIALQAPAISAESRAVVQRVVSQLLESSSELTPRQHLLIAQACYLSLISPLPPIGVAFRHARTAALSGDPHATFVLALMCLTGCKHSRLDTFEIDDDDGSDFVPVIDPKTGGMRLVEADKVREGLEELPLPPEDPRKVLKDVAKQARAERDEAVQAAVSGTPAAAQDQDIRIEDVKARRDLRTGIFFLRRAAEAGHVQATVMMGTLAVTGRSVDKDEFHGERILRSVVKTSGQPYAKRALAQFLLTCSHSDDISAAEAIKLLNEAMEGGDYHAPYVLSMCYLHGLGVQPSDSKVLELLNVAAERNCSPALYDLSLRYLNGEGVPRDVPKFLALAQQSATLGYADAAVCLGDVHFHGLEGQAIDYQSARKYFAIAAAKHHVLGLCNLAAMLYHGLGGPCDHFEAFLLYQKAAERDSLDAWRNLALMYREGHGVAKCQQTADYFLNLVQRVENGEIALQDFK